MEYVVVCVVAACVALLALVSGFGLGTLLMPAFALFFPLDVAIAATAVVHLANNLFNLALVGRHASRAILLRFVFPAVPAAFLGAWLLDRLARLPTLHAWSLYGHENTITPIKLGIAAVMLAFAVMELTPGFSRWALPAKYLPVGGVISGFFGGLSGHQGALRSAFLARSGLSKEQFVGTNVAASILVDLARLAVYGWTFYHSKFSAVRGESLAPLVLAASIAAFAGSFAGSRLITKMTIRGVRIAVGVLLAVTAVLLGSGLI